jgi:hypothetical protein
MLLWLVMICTVFGYLCETIHESLCRIGILLVHINLLNYIILLTAVLNRRQN